MSLISRSNVENGSEIRIGPFVNSSHLMDVVHFQDLSLTFDRTDPYPFFLTSHMIHLDLFPWLRNSDLKLTIFQKLTDRGRN